MPRGGKRPGSGAPKGNLNGLKSGRRSQQLNNLIAALTDTPSIRRILLRLSDPDLNPRPDLKELADAIARRRRRHSIIEKYKKRIS